MEPIPTTLPDEEVLPPVAVDPVLQAAQDQYLRDFPQLLNDHRGRWVAYHGAERIAVADTLDELDRLCAKRGLPPDEVLSWDIVPEPPYLFTRPFHLWPM